MVRRVHIVGQTHSRLTLSTTIEDIILNSSNQQELRVKIDTDYKSFTIVISLENSQETEDIWLSLTNMQVNLLEIAKHQLINELDALETQYIVYEDNEITDLEVPLL